MEGSANGKQKTENSKQKTEDKEITSSLKYLHMSLELDETTLQQKFEEVKASEDKLSIQDFLNDQNISDVANLIYDNEHYESQIISHLSLHRAASVFKILELPTQKKIIKSLPAFKTAELLNELPPDDRTSFLSELPSNAVRELVKTLTPDERKVTLSLLGYPKEVWEG
jgi:magnesium transporter